MKLNATISISFPSGGSREGRTVSIALTDKASGIQFFDGEIAFEEFTAALSCLSDRPLAVAEVRGLEHLGKTRETKHVAIEAPYLGYGTEPYRVWLRENGQEEGWLTSTYLGSRDSLVRNKFTEGMTIHTHRVRYV